MISTLFHLIIPYLNVKRATVTLTTSCTQIIQRVERTPREKLERNMIAVAKEYNTQADRFGFVTHFTTE